MVSPQGPEVLASLICGTGGGGRRRGGYVDGGVPCWEAHAAAERNRWMDPVRVEDFVGQQIADPAELGQDAVGRLVFSGQLINCYLMLRTAGSSTRNKLLAGSGSRVPSEDVDYYNGIRCAGQHPSGVFAGRVNGAVDPFYFHGSVERLG